jgi:hypothetical protein
MPINVTAGLRIDNADFLRRRSAMKYLKTLPAAGLALILTGCIFNGSDCNVNFTDSLRRQNSGYCQTNDWVITSQTDFRDFWDQANMTILPPQPCPTVDFSQYVVIVTAMGGKPNGCYDTEICCIEENSRGDYTVYVRDTYPRKGMSCPAVMVCPVHAVQAPIPSGTVTFQHSR